MNVATGEVPGADTGDGRSGNQQEMGRQAGQRATGSPERVTATPASACSMTRQRHNGAHRVQPVRDQRGEQARQIARHVSGMRRGVGV